MSHKSFVAKRTITFSISVIAALSLFLAGPIVANQKAFAANLCGSGFCEPDQSVITYPSPLSHFFGGDVLYHGFHHWHGGYLCPVTS
jgi:hypothetical protein